MYRWMKGMWSIFVLFYFRQKETEPKMKDNKNISTLKAGFFSNILLIFFFKLQCNGNFFMDPVEFRGGGMVFKLSLTPYQPGREREKLTLSLSAEKMYNDILILKSKKTPPTKK